MLETDEESIRYLKKAYYTDLPAQINTAGSEVEKNQLFAQQHKIGQLLEQGYRVSVSPCAGEADLLSRVDDYSSQINALKRNVAMPGPASMVTEDHQVAIQSRRSKHEPFRNPDPEEVLRPPATRERKRADRGEDVAAVAKLRKEFADITKQLESGLSHKEMKPLKHRRHNIQILLERGYGISLGEMSNPLHIVRLCA